MSVLALCIGLTVLCYLLLGGDCNEGCYSDVYLGFGRSWSRSPPRLC